MDESNDARVTIRRIDWRFLLDRAGQPPFERLVLLGGSAALAGMIVANGVAASVERTLSHDRAADALVVLDGASVRLAEAAACLGPGGVVVIEVDRRRRGRRLLTPGRLSRIAHGHGIHAAGCWWAKPRFDRCNLFLPVEVPAALTWYARAHHTAGSPARRLAETVLAAGAHAGPGIVGPLIPSFLFVATVGPGTGRPPHPHAAPGPAGLVLDGASPGGRVALIAGGEGDWSRVGLLQFAGRGEPRAIGKVPRLAVFNRETEHEQDVLGRLRSELPAALAASIPAPLGLARRGPLVVGVEEFRTGRSLASSARRWGASPDRRERNLGLAAGWLGEFHAAVRVNRGPLLDLGREALPAMLDRYVATFGEERREARLFMLARRTAAGLAPAGLARTWQHMDFGPWNILVDRGRVSVIDWETSREGWPLVDLLYLATHWLSAVRGHRGDARGAIDLAALFLEANPGDRAVAAARQAVDTYLARLRIDRRLVPILLVYGIAEQALERVGRLRATADLPADPRMGNRYVGYMGALAGAVDTLFPPSSGGWDWPS